MPSFTEMAMDQAMRGIEDEPLLYTLDDLKERWSNERPVVSPKQEKTPC